MSKSRITVVEQVYFQQDGQQPVTAESRFGRQLASDEQPYVRRYRVGPEWRPLDCGWVADAAQLVLLNDEGRTGPRNVTDERRAELDRMVVEVSFASDAGTPECHALVRPRESARVEPRQLKNVMVRCVAGKCWVVVRVFPA